MIRPGLRSSLAAVWRQETGGRGLWSLVQEQLQIASAAGVYWEEESFRAKGLILAAQISEIWRGLVVTGAQIGSVAMPALALLGLPIYGVLALVRLIFF